MDYIRDRKSNISFSLHDSRILQIEINEDKWKDAPVYVFGDDKN